MTTLKKAKRNSKSKAIVPDLNLNVSQLKAIDSLSIGKSIYQAAKDAGVSPSTIKIWLGDETFLNEFKKCVTERRQQVVNQLVNFGVNSLTELQKTLESEDPVRRLIAAKAGLTAITPIAKSVIESQSGSSAAPLFQLPPGASVSLDVEIPSIPDTKPTVVIDAKLIESDS